MTNKSIDMFIAHAHEDKHLLKQLEKHLALLQRQQLIAAWQDSDISAGTEWAKQIDTHLEVESSVQTKRVVKVTSSKLPYLPKPSASS